MCYWPELPRMLLKSFYLCSVEILICSFQPSTILSTTITIPHPILSLPSVSLCLFFSSDFCFVWLAECRTIRMCYRRSRSSSKFCDGSCIILKYLAKFTSGIINHGFSFGGRYNYYDLLTVNGMFLFLHDLYDSIRHIMCMCACSRICSFLLVKLGVCIS